MSDGAFEIRVNIYKDLVPFTDFFQEALSLYEENTAFYKLAYDYKTNNPKQTVRLKINYEPDYFRKLLFVIKQREPKKSQGILVNNILSTLYGYEIYNTIKKDKEK